MLILYHC